jgi:hypothetical protein
MFGAVDADGAAGFVTQVAEAGEGGFDVLEVRRQRVEQALARRSEKGRQVVAVLAGHSPDSA